MNLDKELGMLSKEQEMLFNKEQETLSSKVLETLFSMEQVSTLVHREDKVDPSLSHPLVQIEEASSSLASAKSRGLADLHKLPQEELE